MFVAHNHEAHLYAFLAQSLCNVERVQQPVPTSKRTNPLNRTGNYMHHEL
jgi:hypothetical protein